MSKGDMKNNMEIGYLLKLAQHSLRMHMDEKLREIGLTTPQYAVLIQLQEQPGISNADLARASFITPQSMHGIVSLLEKNKLITRNADPKHGRILKTTLTKKGHLVAKNAYKLVHDAEDEMLKKISPTKQKQFAQLLMECITNLK